MDELHKQIMAATVASNNRRNKYIGEDQDDETKRLLEALKQATCDELEWYCTLHGI